ncbi:membrane-spanning 4-domains subfamily A member 8-like [Candoia aspera]|uniref:membrane-spanning 4-domains subfamily A member 8-like n=1 Tax=Candoia aspera TaxID=51853 RepID=UPI002FD82872
MSNFQTNSLTVARDPLKMQNGIMVHIPPSGAHIIQPMRMVQYTDLQRENWTSYQVGPFGRLLKLEAKTLGLSTLFIPVPAIQIINGLIHIGFGGVSVCLFNTFYYISVVVLSGYPFWGGILFIASGSLTVAAGKSFKHSLAQCSARVNIASAVVAFIGMFLLSVQLFLNRHSYAPDYFEFQPDFINVSEYSLKIFLLVLFTEDNIL